MQIVINITEEHYKTLQKMADIGLGYYHEAILKGIPLPKGHGRLIDADRIVRTAEKGGFGNNRDIGFVLSYIPKCRTIIEADKTESEEQT